MELRQLEYFLAVARSGQFTRAARTTHVSQPALSIQVRNLEAEIGAPLFDRVGRKIHLTEAGEILQHHALRILKEVEEARSRLDDMRGLEGGLLTIGCVPSANAYLLPDLVSEFRRLHPGIELRLCARRSGEVLGGVLEGRFNLGIEYFPCEHREVEGKLLLEERHVLAVPPDHPFHRRRRIEFESLAGTPLVLLPAEYRIRQCVDDAARQVGIELMVSVEVDTIAELHALAGKGMGLTFLPQRYVDDLERRGLVKVVEVTRPSVLLSVGVLYHRGRYLSSSARAFLELLLNRGSEES